jgi:hypothetical protein
MSVLAMNIPQTALSISDASEMVATWEIRAGSFDVDKHVPAS